MRNFIRAAADYVVADRANRRGCDEAHCHANDWRGGHLNAFGIAYLPDNFLHVARTEIR